MLGGGGGALVPEGRGGVIDVVANVGGHDEVSDGELVASDELLAVVGEGLLDEGVELVDVGSPGGHGGILLVRVSEEPGAEEVYLVTPAVDDRVAVAGGLPVIGVVEAVADAEGVHDGGELSHTDFLGTLLH